MHVTMFNPINAVFNLSKTTSPKKLFDNDCMTLYIKIPINLPLYLCNNNHPTQESNTKTNEGI